MPVVKATAGWAFQHTAARRRLARAGRVPNAHLGVSTHSRPKAAGRFLSMPTTKQEFQHTAARRRLACGTLNCTMIILFQHTAARRRLVVQREIERLNKEFQHTAARRRLGIGASFPFDHTPFQHTAARRRLAPPAQHQNAGFPFQHTAARRRLAASLDNGRKESAVSTHSRPKAAGCPRFGSSTIEACFNTQPPEGGWQIASHFNPKAAQFQHTAARRRLGAV